jgi:hypothetical protein
VSMELTLRQELYLIAHDPSGKPLVHQSSMALGLGGAVLLDLALNGRVAPTGGRASVTDRTPIGDEVADDLLTLISLERDLTFWIKKVAEDVYERTRTGLVDAGVLDRVTKGRVLTRTRYPVSDLAWVVRATSGVRAAVEGWKEPDARRAALCGLVGVLRVDSELYLGQSSSELVGRLLTIARESTPEVRDLVGLVEAIIAEAALAVYR